MLSPHRWRLPRHLLIDRLDRRKRVGFLRALVLAVPFHAREAQRETAGILRARLDVVQRTHPRLDHHRIRRLARRAVLVRHAEQDYRRALDGQAAGEEPGRAIEGLAEAPSVGAAVDCERSHS